MFSSKIEDREKTKKEDLLSLTLSRVSICEYVNITCQKFIENTYKGKILLKNEFTAISVHHV